MKIKYSERRILLMWAEENQDGPYGGGVIEFPMEKSLQLKLENCTPDMDLEFSHGEQLVINSWISHSSGTPEEDMLVAKLKNLFRS